MVARDGGARTHKWTRDQKKTVSTPRLGHMEALIALGIDGTGGEKSANADEDHADEDEEEEEEEENEENDQDDEEEDEEDYDESDRFKARRFYPERGCIELTTPLSRRRQAS